MRAGTKTSRTYGSAAAACLGAGGLVVSFWATSSAQPAPALPPPVPAVAADTFLNSIGVNLHVDQGYDPNAYIAPLRYTGIREVRDGDKNVESDVMIHKLTGVRFAVSGYGDLNRLLASARKLAAADALLAVEGPNEPNNFPIIYDGVHGGGMGGSWRAIATYQRDLYAAVKADPVLRHYPVFAPSETGAETDNVGLQYLVVPRGAHALFPAGTHFADYANVHNAVIGNGNWYAPNQAWNAADPTLNGRWDGLYGNNGDTWHGHYGGYTKHELRTLPRVTTETSWDTSVDPGGEASQAVVLTNTYLAQFKRGWAYTFVYEMKDGEGSTGDQGLYHGMTPKPAAVDLHNLTSILADDRPIRRPGSLRFAIPDAPPTVHSLLLQKSTGEYDLVVWDERVQGTDTATVDFGVPQKSVRVFDITRGTSAIEQLTNTASVRLTLSNHAMILKLD
jgi:hypothetical protein